MKVENRINVPAAHISLDMLERISSIAKETVEGFPLQNLRYIFCAPLNNVEFNHVQYPVSSIPSDLSSIFIQAQADNNQRLMEVRLQNSFTNFNQVGDRRLNQIVVHAADEAWVHKISNEIRMLFEKNKFVIRSFVYKYVLIVFWLSAVVMWFTEFAVLHVIYPRFRFSGPLSPLGAILLASTLFGSLLVYANFIVRFYSYWFPYFEIENNLKRARKSGQKLIGAAMFTFFLAALANAFHLIFAPVFTAFFK